MLYNFSQPDLIQSGPFLADVAKGYVGYCMQTGTKIENQNSGEPAGGIGTFWTAEAVANYQLYSMYVWQFFIKAIKKKLKTV